MEPGLPSKETYDTSHLQQYVYSDDGSAARDMQGGGVRNWLLAVLSDAAVEINISKGSTELCITNAVTVRRKRATGPIRPTPTLRQLTAPLKLDYDGHKLKIADHPDV